jgi:hypothetical protein
MSHCLNGLGLLVGNGPRTVCNHDRVFSRDGFVGDSLRQINSQEDRVSLPSGMVEGGFEKYSTTVSCTVARKRVDALQPVLSKLLSAKDSG